MPVPPVTPVAVEESARPVVVVIFDGGVADIAAFTVRVKA